MAKLQVDDPKNVEYGTALLQELVKGKFPDGQTYDLRRGQ